jgi:hypothetical protein
VFSGVGCFPWAPQPRTGAQPSLTGRDGVNVTVPGALRLVGLALGVTDRRTESGPLSPR